MTGSLSSIVHSEEELAGSYNWDYLLDWCPQYQNLAHVFKEISKLKDDDPSSANNAQAGPSGGHLDQHSAQLQPRQFPNFALKNPSIGIYSLYFFTLSLGVFSSTFVPHIMTHNVTHES